MIMDSMNLESHSYTCPIFIEKTFNKYKFSKFISVLINPYVLFQHIYNLNGFCFVSPSLVCCHISLFRQLFQVSHILNSSFLENISPMPHPACKY